MAYLVREEFLDQKVLREDEEIPVSQDLKAMLGKWESVDLRVLLDHQGVQEKLVAPETQDSLVQQEKLVLLEPWVTEVHLALRVCKASLDRQVFQEWQELKEIEEIQETRDPKGILDLLVDLVSLDHLDSLV